ncbi:hypothetical protein RISK_002405 [Rhodopirellula islandica]|uniref:Uncharacterized protein n=1 Tax=Rhodopirellula islandica TaxID=595434 RepID=A0A0J1BGU7_RHOIS|nr:hypothetical protein [Rhodopirellula islandica]KLU05773.1 hypothetical protein RISK_002405 [Rhodopirellula islandica]
MTDLPTTSKKDQPAFGCVVYVQRTASGRTRGRVANLEGIETEGGSERDVLATIVRDVRARISEHMGREEDVPWLDPPAEKLPDEVKRFLPLHL